MTSSVIYHHELFSKLPYYSHIIVYLWFSSGYSIVYRWIDIIYCDWFIDTKIWDWKIQSEESVVEMGLWDSFGWEFSRVKRVWLCDDDCLCVDMFLDVFFDLCDYVVYYFAYESDCFVMQQIEYCLKDI